MGYIQVVDGVIYYLMGFESRILAIESAYKRNK